MKKIGVLLILGFLFFPKLQAQEHLHIKQAYDKYGKEQGAVFVQLSKDILSQGNTRIRFYKSMIIREDSEKASLILELIRADQTEEYNLKEVFSGKKVETLICQVKTEKISGNEYILYKNNKGKISLVYIRGDFPPSELDRELNKLKNLFIKVKKKN